MKYEKNTKGHLNANLVNKNTTGVSDNLSVPGHLWRIRNFFGFEGFGSSLHGRLIFFPEWASKQRRFWQMATFLKFRFISIKLMPHPDLAGSGILFGTDQQCRAPSLAVSTEMAQSFSVLRIRIRIRIRMLLGLLDPDPSIIKQK